MFEECHKCEQGLECKYDYATLKYGYWWKWRNESHKHRYVDFLNNLLAPFPAVSEDDVEYPYPIPTPFRCLTEESCKGGLDSECAKATKVHFVVFVAQGTISNCKPARDAHLRSG